MIATLAVGFAASVYASYTPIEIEDAALGYTGFESTEDLPYASQTDRWKNQASGTVTEYGEKAKPAGYGTYTAGENFLHIETEEGPLERTFTSFTGWEDDNTNVVKMGEVYVDTMVKFTAVDSDEEPSGIGTGSQFALWLKAVDADGVKAGVTNLMVKCATYNTDGGSGAWGQKSVALDVAVVPETWHRITIKTLVDTSAHWSGNSLGCFLIYVDGNLVSAKAADYADVFKVGELEIPVVLNEGAAYYTNRQLFPSMVAPAAANSGKLTSIGFSGTGDIDMFNVTDADPYYIATTGIELDKETLTLKVGVSETLVATVAPATATDKTVSWTSSDEAVATVSDAGLVTAIAVGEVTITATAADGQEDICTVTVEAASTDPTTAEGLQLLITQAEAGVMTTIKLGGNITMGATALQIAADKDITLDLQGYTLQNSAAGYTIDNAGKLTIIDTADEKGTITHVTADTSSTIRNLGTLTISDITVSGNYIGVKNDEGAGCNGGKGYGELTLNGVTYNGDDQAVQNWGVATINGGTYNGAVYTWACGANEGNVNGRTTILGGTFNAEVASVNYYYNSAWPTANAQVTIKDGIFNAAVAAKYTKTYTGEEPVRGEISIEGGAFADLSAVKYAVAGKTIKAAADTTADLANVAKDITVDANGYVVTLSGTQTLNNNLTLICSGETAEKGFKNEATLTIAAGKTLNLSTLSWGAGVVGSTGASIVLEAGAAYKQGLVNWDDAITNIFSTVEGYKIVLTKDEGVATISTEALPSDPIYVPEGETVESVVSNATSVAPIIITDTTQVSYDATTHELTIGNGKYPVKEYYDVTIADNLVTFKLNENAKAEPATVEDAKGNEIPALSVTSDGVGVGVQTKAGLFYGLQTKTELSGDWIEPTSWVKGDGAGKALAAEAAGTSGFYRVKVVDAVVK